MRQTTKAECVWVSFSGSGNDGTSGTFAVLYQRCERSMLVGVFDVRAEPGAKVASAIRASGGRSASVSGDVSRAADVEAAVDAKQTKISVTGIDRQQVGQVAAEMRSLRPPDPYKNKGVRYADERLKKKVGKTGAK